jgi:hypothetical protein
MVRRNKQTESKLPLSQSTYIIIVITTTMVQRNKQTESNLPLALLQSRRNLVPWTLLHCASYWLGHLVILLSAPPCRLQRAPVYGIVQGHLATLLLPVKRNCELWLSDVQKFEN